MERIVVLTGAGISQESGIETLRDGDGLWARHRIEDVCTPDAFRRDPALVHAFYNARRAQLTGVAPNPAHTALAALEAAARGGAWGGELCIVTQNIDDLHERAGSRNVIHMHGALRSIRCTACGTTRAWDGDSTPHAPCPACGVPALRPDVVWFGEIPLHMERIAQELARCDLFVAIGTSGQVYPAAGFVDLAPSQARTLELNLAPSQISGHFVETRLGRAGDLVPRFVREVIGR
jgi:NAD-dependent deacetylase